MSKSASQGAQQNCTPPKFKGKTDKLRTKMDKVSGRKQKKITDMMEVKGTKRTGDESDEIIIDSSSDATSPEAKVVHRNLHKPDKIASKGSEYSSTEQKKGKSYLGMDFGPEFVRKDDKGASEKPNINIYDYVPSQESSGPSQSPDQRGKSSPPKKRSTLLKSPHRRLGIFQRYQNKTGTTFGSPVRKRHSIGNNTSGDKMKNIFGSVNLKESAKKKLKIPNLSQFQRGMGASASTSSSSATRTKPETELIEIGSSSSDQEKSANNSLTVSPVMVQYDAKRKVNIGKKVEKSKRSKLSLVKSHNNSEGKGSKQTRVSGIGEKITNWESSDAEGGPVTPSSTVQSNRKLKETDPGPLGSDPVIILSDSDHKESGNERGSRNINVARGSVDSSRDSRVENSLVRKHGSQSTEGTGLEKTNKHKTKAKYTSESAQSSNKDRNVFENLFGSSDSSPSIHSQQSAFELVERRNSFLSLSSFSDAEQNVASTDITSDRPSSPVFGNCAAELSKSKVLKVTERNATKSERSNDVECREDIIRLNQSSIPECQDESSNQSKTPKEGRSGSSTPIYKDRASVFDQLNTEFLKIKSASSACSGEEDQDVVSTSNTLPTSTKSNSTIKPRLVTNKMVLKSPISKRKAKATHFGMRKISKGHIRACSTNSASGTESESVHKKPAKKMRTSSEIKEKGPEIKRESTRKRSLTSKYEEYVTGIHKKGPTSENVADSQGAVDTGEAAEKIQNCSTHQALASGVSEVCTTNDRKSNVPTVHDDHNFFSGSPSGPSVRKVHCENVGKISVKSVKRKFGKKVTRPGDIRVNTSTESDSDFGIVKPTKRPRKRTSLDSNSNREKLERKRSIPRKYSEYVASTAHLEDLFEKEAEHLSQTSEELAEVKTGRVLSKQMSSQSTLTTTGDSCTSGPESSIKESSESDLDTPLNVIAADKLKASKMLAPHGPLGTPPRMLDFDDSDDEGTYSQRMY